MDLWINNIKKQFQFQEKSFICKPIHDLKTISY